MDRFFDYGRRFLSSFTAVFTLVILASTGFIAIYSNPYLPFRLIAQALVIAAVSSLLNFIFVSEKPIRKRSLAIRTLVHFILLLASVAGCARYFEWFSFSHTPSVVTFALLFLAVYALIWGANFFRDLMDEKAINRRLKEYLSVRGGFSGAAEDRTDDDE
ncbi:MAG: DUF3021 domain-containing protein [Bacillota bacterium]